MPKEIVESWSDHEPYHVKVGWTPDHSVQVGVEADEGRSLFWLLLGIGSAFDAEQTNRRLDELGRAVREIVERNAALGDDQKGRPALPDHQVGADLLNALDTMTIIEYSGVWSTLDRGGCNRLIKLLRRARDAAYGADE